MVGIVHINSLNADMIFFSFFLLLQRDKFVIFCWKSLVFVGHWKPETNTASVRRYTKFSLAHWIKLLFLSKRQCENLKGCVPVKTFIYRAPAWKKSMINCFWKAHTLLNSGWIRKSGTMYVNRAPVLFVLTLVLLL